MRSIVVVDVCHFRALNNHSLYWPFNDKGVSMWWGFFFRTINCTNINPTVNKCSSIHATLQSIFNIMCESAKLLSHTHQTSKITTRQIQFRSPNEKWKITIFEHYSFEVLTFSVIDYIILGKMVHTKANRNRFQMLILSWIHWIGYEFVMTFALWTTIGKTNAW